MENATKALLIAAAVLIAIVIIAGGVALLKSGGNSKEQVDKTSQEISSTSQSFAGDISLDLEDVANKNLGEFVIVSENDSVCVGEQIKLYVKVGDEKINSSTKIQWKSSDTNIATVNNGVVIGRKIDEKSGLKGQTIKITAKYKDYENTKEITVKPRFLGENCPGCGGTNVHSSVMCSGCTSPMISENSSLRCGNCGEVLEHWDGDCPYSSFDNNGCYVGCYYRGYEQSW